MNTDELDRFLLDARKSYRNIYLFNKRVKDIIKFIEFNLADFRFELGLTKFCSPPKNGTRVRLDHWAWDWLGMYHYEFFFGSQNNVRFSIFLVSDTGFFDKDLTHNQKLDIESFNAPEQSQSQLVFIVGKNTWWSESKGFSQMLKGINSPLVEMDADKTFLAKSYNLNQFVDQNSTKALLTDFVAFCHNNGIQELQTTVV